jgi:hypothetical protein
VASTQSDRGAFGEDTFGRVSSRRDRACVPPKQGTELSMTQLLFLNLIFFIIPTCGASAFALFIYRFLRGGGPPAPGSPPGGTKSGVPSAGPDDLARSA